MSKLLIIDDRSENLLAFTALAEQHLPNLEIEAALGGTNGLERALAWVPDVVLLDVNMPDFDGYRVCRALKRSPRTSRTQVILITATRLDADERAAGLDLGSDDYLTKPIDGALLAARVRAALRTKEASDAQAHQVTITERRRLESEGYYRALFDAVSESVLVVDAEGAIVDANTATFAMTGLERERLIGRSVLEVVHPSQAAQAELQLASAAAWPVAQPFQLQRAEGSPLAVEISASAFPAGVGQPARWLWVMRDVSERRHLEDQLRQAQKMEAIGTLAAGIAHDFNNLLTPILGYSAELLEATSAESVERTTLQKIVDAANRGSQLVRQLLACSRKTDPVMKDGQLADIVRDAVTLLRAMIPATVRIRLELCGGDSTVRADAPQIHQVLVNLCVNAFHAMRKTGGELRIGVDRAHVGEEFARSHANLSEGAFVRLTVCDDGPGMIPDVVERIFEPFFTTKGVNEGTGLGLPMAYGIVAQHGGELTVSSQPGCGSTFCVYLPAIARVADAETAPPKPTLDLAGPTPSAEKSLPPTRVLFVDDEEILVELGTLLLQRLGYEVTGTADSVEALELFRRDPDQFGLIITDQTMPRLTGMELVKEIRAICQVVPIVLTSGLTNQFDADAAHAMGINAILDKPYKKADLVGAIAAAQRVDQRGVTRSSPGS